MAGLIRQSSDVLKERRGIIGGLLLSLRRPRGDDGFLDIRKGRKTYRHRFSRLVVLLAAVFAFCLAAFGLHAVLQGEVEVGLSSTEAVEKVIFGVDGERPVKRKRRPRHVPCEVSLLDSVDNILEHTALMNLTEFVLQYIEMEEDNVHMPRFAGHQSLDQREGSFHARSQKIHCGFVRGAVGAPSTGFDVDDHDKNYMNTCKVVVSSCIFGSSDFLRRPTSRRISDYSKKNVCFVMFVDQQTLSTLSSDGYIPDDRGNIGLWKIIVVRNSPYKDMRRTGKVPKFLSHRLFPSSRYSIWLDSKMRLNTDPMLVIEYFLWRRKSEYAISNHYDRHCVWDEVVQNKRLNKYNHTAIDEQFHFYRSDGLVKFDPTDPNTPLPSYVPEGSFIVRAHTPMSNLFSCLWFNEVDRFTSRDQLGFAYTYLKLRRLNPQGHFYLNMFKDCERRAIVKLFHHREIPSPPSTP